MLASIINTPLVWSSCLSEKFGCTVYVKEDYHNPGGSSKDRAAYYMLMKAWKKGFIGPGGTVVEASSGNTGLGLAWLSKAFGYQCRIYVSTRCSEEKLAILKKYGAECVVCDHADGPTAEGSTQFEAQRFAETHPGTYYCNQYENLANRLAHYETTGPEIWQQSKRAVTHFIAGVGTGGTISGVGKYLKKQHPSVQVWGVEPSGSVLAPSFYHQCIPKTKHEFQIEGIGRNFIPGILDFTCIDRFIQVNTQDSVRAAATYRDDCQGLCGFSSAAVLAAISQAHAQHSFQPHDVLVLYFPDHGSRYLSKLYNPDWLREKAGWPMERTGA